MKATKSLFWVLKDFYGRLKLNQIHGSLRFRARVKYAKSIKIHQNRLAPYLVINVVSVSVV